MSDLFASHRAIIFDMDGVITDTEPLHAEAERLVCREHGLNVSEAEWDNFRGRTAVDIFGYLREQYGDERTPGVDELIDFKTKAYLELVSQALPTVPGALEFVNLARRHFDKLALATSSNSAVQRAVFERYGLDRFFDAVTTGDDLTHGKPHPEAYQKTAVKLGLAPQDCLVVEDSDNGVRSGVAAGCTVLGITTTLPADRLLSLGASSAVADFEEMARQLGLGQ